MGLSHQELLNALDYDPETGIFIWKIRPANRVNIGDVAGSKPTPYIQIRLFNRYYLAHRLAWFYVFGSFPSKLIDHIDGNKINNKISNLREATVAENAWNRNKPNIGNKSGQIGVFFRKNRWIASISVQSKRLNLGSFMTFEDACHAYKSAKIKYHNHKTKVC